MGTTHITHTMEAAMAAPDSSMNDQSRPEDASASTARMIRWHNAVPPRTRRRSNALIEVPFPHASDLDAGAHADTTGGTPTGSGGGAPSPRDFMRSLSPSRIPPPGIGTIEDCGEMRLGNGATRHGGSARRERSFSGASRFDFGGGQARMHYSESERLWGGEHRVVTQASAFRGPGRGCVEGCSVM